MGINHRHLKTLNLTLGEKLVPRTVLIRVVKKKNEIQSKKRKIKIK
jgi:hypothetical protein